MREHLDFDLAMSREMLLGEIIARNARRYPDKEILVFGERRITCRELEERVNRLANAMLRMGVKEGDKVGVFLLNSAEVIEIYFAAAKIGAVNVPINVRLSPSEISYIFENSDTSIVFTGGNFLPVMEKIKGGLPLLKEIVVVQQENKNGAYRDYETTLSSGSPIRPEVWLQDGQDAFIVYTSGTTGRPKGAVLTHKNLYYHSAALMAESNASRPRRPEIPVERVKALSIVPLFHVAGISTTIKNILAMDLTVVRNFDPVGLLETIHKERITSLFLAPAMWIMVMSHPDFKKYDVTSLLRASYGAAPTPNAVKERILEAFPNAGLMESFGQTEMSPSVALMKSQDALRKEGSVGPPQFNVEIRVVDDDMNDVPVGEVGEAVYRGVSMFTGYYKDPEANQEAFRGGWFHSGDLVRQDEEGFLYVVDRKKDMIVSGGENIYSAEVEAVLHCHPAVLESAVIGVPDPKWGESVKAFIVLRPGMEARDEEIIQHCGKHMARFKIPKSIEYMQALPRNAAGKVLKKALRNQS